MQNIIENLERHFNSFMDQQNDWGFFLGLSDYVNFIINTPETEKFIFLINAERKAEEKILQKLGEETIKEIELAKEKLLKTIKDNNVSSPRLTNEIEEYENHKNGKIIGSEPLPSSLGECLNDIILALWENNYKELIKDFIDEKGRITKNDFSEKLGLYEELRRKHKEREKTALWGAWGHLCLVYISILKRDEELEKLKKDKTQFFTALNLKGVFYEMKRIEEGNLDKAVQFKKETYKSYSSRIHNHLIKELSQPPKDHFTNFSLENLIKVQKVLKIVLDELELQDINRLCGNKIPIKKFDKEDILLSEAEAILAKIDCVKIMNWEIKQLFENKDYAVLPPLFSEKDVSENLFLSFLSAEDLNELKKIAEEINRKIKEKEPEIKNQIEKSGNKKTEKVILSLSKQGDLCNKAKGKCYAMGEKSSKCYAMGEKSKRHKLIRFLVENKGYQETGLIASEIGYSSNQITSTEIRKIRNNIKKFLKINGEDLLTSKKGSGYKINSKYEIRLKDK